MYLYMPSFFFRYRCKPTCFPKNKTKKGNKTETYKVKINICARCLKVTFGFQRHKLKSTTASSTLSPSPTTNKQGLFFSFERIFMQQKASVMKRRQHGTSSLMMQSVRWVCFSTRTTSAHTAELKALAFLSLTY